MTKSLLSDDDYINHKADAIVKRIRDDLKPNHTYRATIHDGGATHETATDDPAVIAAWLRAVADSINAPKAHP